VRGGRRARLLAGDKSHDGSSTQRPLVASHQTGTSNAYQPNQANMSSTYPVPILSPSRQSRPHLPTVPAVVLAASRRESPRVATTSSTPRGSQAAAPLTPAARSQYQHHSLSLCQHRHTCLLPA